MYEYPILPASTHALTFTPGIGRTPPPTSRSVTIPRIVRPPRGGVAAPLVGLNWGSAPASEFVTALGEVGDSASVSEGLQPAVKRIMAAKGARRRNVMSVLLI